VNQRLSRHEARTRALEILFAADVRDASATVLLGEQPQADAFTETLVEAVVEHALAIDALIGRYAQGWAIDRMPAVDRAILRLGVAELLHVDEVPPKVAIDEAVELAKDLSTDASPKFVNGVLAAIAEAEQLL
jgi:N utilization substance protein B